MNDRRLMDRRNFLSAIGTVPAVLAASCASSQKISQPRYERYRSKAMGCFMGAAIADAMGGPVEWQHYKRIAREFSDFDDFLPYRHPPGLIPVPRPGYALGGAPGNVTGDTYIRMELARFVLQNYPPFTVHQFADWLIRNADIRNWGIMAVQSLTQIHEGKVSPENAGLKHQQGGGGGWWQPIAMIYAGDPKKASNVTWELCRIWKAPLERDILSSVVAGQAEAFKEGSTIGSIVDAVLNDSFPLARRLFERAVTIASEANSANELYEKLYQHCLVTECTTRLEGSMPPHVEPKDDADGFYNSILFAEQQPLALAYFVFGKGDPKRTVLTAVKGGRGACSIAANTASWLGAMSGEPVWPPHWLGRIQQANLSRINLRQTAEGIIQKGIENGTVRI